MAVRKYDFHPFWSYNSPELLVENIMNVAVFIPVGMMLGSLLRVKGSWSRNGSWLRVKGSLFFTLLIGCGISITIETLQFFFMKGFSELDDVMHNTLGCLLGYSLWLMAHGAWLRVHGERLTVKG